MINFVVGTSESARYCNRCSVIVPVIKLVELSEQGEFGLREHGEYCRLDAEVEIETMLMGDPRTGWEDGSGMMRCLWKTG
jgi:hypothetical protein